MTPEHKDHRIEPNTVLIEADPSRVEIVPLSAGVVFLTVGDMRLRIAFARSIEIRRP